MKQIKNFMLLSTAAVLVASSFTSCKKGENDPFLSLKSRKARVANEWTMTSSTTNGTSTDKYTSGGVTYTTNNTTTGSFADGKETTYTTSSTVVGTNTFTSKDTSISYYTEEWTFDKEGNVTHVYTREDKDNDFGWTKKMTTEKGRWNFLGGVGDDVSKKEQMIIYITERIESTTEDNGSTNTAPTVTYTDNYGSVWTLTGLAGDEMLVKVTSAYNNGSDYSENTTTEFTLTEK